MSRSTSPVTPATRPVAEQRQMVQVGKPLGRFGLSAPQRGAQRGDLAAIPVQLPAQVFHRLAVVRITTSRAVHTLYVMEKSLTHVHIRVADGP